MADYSKSKAATESEATKSLPSPSLEAVETAYKVLIAAMIDTNADTLKMTISGFHDKQGNNYGDFKFRVTRKRPDNATLSNLEGR